MTVQPEAPTLLTTVSSKTLLSILKRLTHQLHGLGHDHPEDPNRVKRDMVEAEILRRMESNA